MVKIVGERCGTCHVLLTEELIYIRPNGHTECRTCIRNKKSTPRAKAVQAAYDARPNRVQARKDYRDNNPEKEHARAKKYHQEHKEEINRKHRERWPEYNQRSYPYLRSKRIIRINARQRGIENPDKCTVFWIQIIKTQPCAYCNAPGPSTIDHVIPIFKGGKNHWSNINPACGKCNDSKGSKNLEDWLIDRKSPLLLRGEI